MENEILNCPENHGYHLGHNFGPGRTSLANTLATINLYAFALHAMLACLCALVAALLAALRAPREVLPRAGVEHPPHRVPGPAQPVRDDAEGADPARVVADRDERLTRQSRRLGITYVSDENNIW